MKTKSILNLTVATALAAALAVPAAFGASQTWSPTPADANWPLGANWVGGAAPGALNLTGNTVNNDVATFNTPLAGGIGGALNPILTDDATTVGNRARQLGSILFTGDAGPYVFQAASALSLPSFGALYLSHNGSITIAESVAHSQHFFVPIYTRLPSSTAGIYNFVNNSTNAGVALYIETATNDSANTRGTEFRLGGSNNSTNSIGVISAGTTTSGANGLTKQGSGTWILLGQNDLRTQTAVNINAGTLIVRNSLGFSVAANVTIANTGILQLDGVNTDGQPFLRLNNGGTIRMNGVASLNGVQVGNAAATTVTLGTADAGSIFTVGTGTVGTSIVSGGAPDTVLNTAGAGTVAFGTANTYVGRWAFGAKTNQLLSSDALGTGLNASVKAGAILDLSQLGGVAFVPTTSGFGGSGTGTAVGSTAATVVSDVGGSLDLTGKSINLDFNPASASGDLTRPSLYVAQGGLTLSGNTFFVNNTSGSPLGVGTYRLVQSASAITSGGGYAAIISGSGLVGGAAAAIQVSGGNVDLVVSIYVPKDLVWSGSGSVWDLGSSSTWLNGVTPSVFNNSDNALFNSVGVANPAVTLTGTLAPASVTVDTSAGDYSFGGSGTIVGTTSLKKVGAGVLTVSTVNTYAGGTVVSNGTLRVGQANAISSTGSGNVEVYGSSVLDLNGVNNTINGLIGTGSVDNQLGGDSILTLGNNDASGTFSGQIKNTAGNVAISKVGTGTQVLSSANTYTGNTTVNNGTLRVANPTALGAGPLVVNGGVLDMQTGLTVPSLAGSGGVIANNTSATTNVLEIVGGTATTYSGNITDGSGGGGVAVRIVNGSALTFGGNNTFTGGSFVGSGSTFNIPNSPAAVGGFVIASNNAHLFLSGGSGTPGTPNQVTTVARRSRKVEQGKRGRKSPEVAGIIEVCSAI